MRERERYRFFWLLMIRIKSYFFNKKVLDMHLYNDCESNKKSKIKFNNILKHKNNGKNFAPREI